MQHTINTTIKPQNCTIIANYHSKLTSPLIINDNIYCVAENGDILKFNENGEVQIVFTLLGQPSSITYRDSQEYFIVSDFAHQSIFARQDTKNQQIHNLISDFNNRAFLGPNTIKMGPSSGNLYFTDSGPFLQTSLQNRQGSVFVYDFQTQSVNCLTFRTLAYPSGLQSDQQEKYLIVSQTGMNRLLKFYLNQNSIGSTNFTVFYQFSGRMGPTAISRFENNFYVALFQFGELSQTGSIAVVNLMGEMIEKFTLPVGPQITGLFINESAMTNVCSQIYVSEGHQIHKVTLKPEENKMSESIIKHR